jgi:KRAB domain-containing zinc finger protein
MRPKAEATAAESKEDKFRCPLCLRAMRNSTSLRCHVWSHAKAKHVQCAQCGKAFGALCLLAAHVAAKHLRLDRPYLCPACPAAHRSARGLATHYARKHRAHVQQRDAQLDFLCCYVRLNVMRCAACGKRFINKAQLLEHQAMHTGLKRYSCKQCGRAFKTGR